MKKLKMKGSLLLLILAKIAAVEILQVETTATAQPQTL
jgi:hypothetical protein